MKDTTNPSVIQLLNSSVLLSIRWFLSAKQSKEIRVILI